MENAKMYYSTKEAAEFLKVSLRTIYRMLCDGRIKHSVFAGKNIRIPARQLERLKQLNTFSTSINTTLQK